MVMIRLVTIKRLFLRERETFGVVSEDNVPTAVSLENSWYDNMPFKSCIPPAPGDPPLLYLCKRIESFKYGDVFEVQDVPGRSDIICGHIGNTAKDTTGCILFGKLFGFLEGTPAILQSQSAMNEFKNRFNNVNEFVLKIGWYL